MSEENNNDNENIESQDVKGEEIKAKVNVSAEPLEMAGEDLTDKPALSILGVSYEELAGVEFKNLDHIKGSNGLKWGEAITAGTQSMMNHSFAATVAEPGSLWEQHTNYEGNKLSAARPRIGKSKEDSGRLSGDRAILRTKAMLGLGTIVQIPLWHSGIWISLKAPSDAALLELDRRIALEKVNLGRHTNGMVFSNSSVYIVNHLVKFALSLVFDHSVKDIEVSDLTQHIRSTDLPSLFWGLGCVLFPKGYPLAQPCLSNPEKCQHVVREMLAISKLHWVNNDAITDKQRKHMSRRNRHYTVDEIAQYQDMSNKFSSKSFNLNESVEVWLGVPTVEQYLDSGFMWVDGVVRMVEDSFGTQLRGDERDTYINDQAKLSTMNQYSHWVTKIVLDGEEIVDDQDTLQEIFAAVSSEDEISTKFFEEVGKYIDGVTVAVIAIPNYDCPKCGGSQSKEEEHRILIPLDIISVFFTLQVQHLSLALHQS